MTLELPPPLQTIVTGNYANDGTGDDLRTAFEKVNTNFSVLLNEVNVVDGENIGTGVGIFSDRVNEKFEFKTLTSNDNSIEITSPVGSETVNLKTTARVINDVTPQLGGDLDLNSFNIIGNGDVQTTVFGYDMRILANLLFISIQTNQLTIDMGGILSTLTGIDFDLGTIDSPALTNLDFGSI